MLDKSTKELADTGDPFLTLAAALVPMSDQLREASKTRQGARYRLVPRYMKALLAASAGLIAPDANGTLRVTYGQVLGVDSADGLFYKPQTTLAGIVEKQTGQGDFDAPARELAAIKALRAGRETAFSRPGASRRSGAIFSPPWIPPAVTRDPRRSMRAASCAAFSSTERTTRWSPTSSTTRSARVRSTSIRGTSCGFSPRWTAPRESSRSSGNRGRLQTGTFCFFLQR